MAEKRQKNGRSVWTVALKDLVVWAEKEGLSVQPEQMNAREQSGSEQSNTREQSRTVTSEHSAEQSNGLHEQLLDRFEQTQRKAIYLELQLQQTQRLLCERNDDQHEREARAREAEALAELAQEEAEMAKQEAAQAKIELETLRTEAEAKAKAEEALQLMAADLQSLKTEMATKEAQWEEARKPWYKKLFRKSS